MARALLLLLFFFVVIVSRIPAPLVLAADDTCSPKTCGNLNISAPFGLVVEGPEENKCGLQMGFQVQCTGDVPHLGYYGSKYRLRILHIFYGNFSLLVSDVHNLQDFDLLGCHVPTADTASKLGQPFSISPLNQNLIFYNCTKPPTPETVSRDGLVETVCHNNTFVRVGGRYNEIGVGVRGYELEGCSSTAVPVLGNSGSKVNASDYLELIREGFLLTWQPPPVPDSANYSRLLKVGFVLEWAGTDIGNCPACNASGGQCWYDNDSATFVCICPGNRQNGSTCTGSKRTGTKIIIIVLTSAAATLLSTCIYVLIWHRKGKRLWFLLCKRTSSSTERKYEAMIVSYGSLAPKRYVHSEVMKITSSRNNQLGQGGYGVVFKGRLHDGRLVAVKFLHDCKGNGDEFVNEVMSIGRTSHVNIVSLFGFCLEGSKRALIYEYMCNGSLDKYIYSENPKEILGWERLYAIAIGIARGLEYLHHSCNTRIVHFDIKPQNILLDQDFCPKIADFGLAKLCHTKESKLSMTGARGTIGFIAPEVHSRTFGVVSTKSDVYSYGMMLLEMVGGRRNMKSIVEKSSEKYFPDWIYDHFAQDDGLQACEVTSEIEEIARKMTIIGLWCIQVLPVYRPTITKVLEMFERRLDDLDMPPKQNFSELLENSDHNMNVESVSSTRPEETSLVNSKIIQ